MKISNYEMVQRAETNFVKMESQKVEIEFFQARPPDTSPAVQLTLSQDALDPKVQEPENLFHVSEEELAKIRLLEKLITALTGKEFKFNQLVKVKDTGSTPSIEERSSPALGIQISTSHELYEKEDMTFSSKGLVQTGDGRTIEFSLNLKMHRSYYEKSESIVQIGERLQDPLVINLDGKGIAFGQDKLELDLTFDGRPEQFAMLAPGSGFLALDKNDNGIIDDGSELFGPSTGRGFEELAQYDTDQNDWIDEGDEVFSALKIWQINKEGIKTLVGLKEAGVGAIFLGHEASQYHVKEGAQLLARIRETGTYLKENGLAGAIHEVDLKI